MKTYVSMNLFRNSKETLKEFCKEYHLPYDRLITDKQNGFATIWLVIDYEEEFYDFVAYTRAANQKKITFHSEQMKADYDDKLDTFHKYVKGQKRNYDQEVNTSFVVESDQTDKFDVDSILDKIAKSGMSSLTDKEIKFLESYSKD